MRIAFKMTRVGLVEVTNASGSYQLYVAGRLVAQSSSLEFIMNKYDSYN